MQHWQKFEKKQNTSHHVWSYDFMEDRTERGHKLGTLAVIDASARQCLATRIAPAIPASAVVRRPECLLLTRGVPKFIHSGNGSEFVARAVCQ